MSVDLLQNKQIRFLMTAFLALGGLSAFLVYLDNKKHQKLKAEIMNLEKEIKGLQLDKLKNRNS